ncbi:MAG: DUF308 domain-containing protein [Bacillus sp. (in: Bacteria)]|nr:DUF308 domain-containing protein [Bacillus sp. (in: firmicutes)]MCM1425060.1 DUF308 domain-containing protein [Eubacterium sp.]
MKKILQNEVVSSLIMIALGIVLMVWPGAAMDIACLVIGCGLIIVGAIGLIILFVKRKKNEKEGISKDSIIVIMKSVIMIVVGIILIVKKNSVVSVLPFVIGVLIIVNSAVNIIQAILKRKQNNKWIIPLVVGFVTAIIGILMISNPFGAVISQIFIMGLGLAVDGVSNLVGGLTIRK